MSCLQHFCHSCINDCILAAAQLSLDEDVLMLVADSQWLTCDLLTLTDGTWLQTLTLVLTSKLEIGPNSHGDADNAASSWSHGSWLGWNGVICNQGMSCDDVMLHRVLLGKDIHCPQSCLILDGLILHHKLRRLM